MKIGSQLLYLSRKDIESLQLQMNEVINVLEEAFIEKAENRIELPPKTGIRPQNNDAFINAMLCSIPKFNAAGVKWVAAYPQNKRRNLPQITGLIILNCPETGLPLAIMEGSLLTAIRTGAVTGLSAKYLAKKDSSIASIIGCGVQASTQLEALLATTPDLQLIKTYDINSEALELFSRKMQERFGVNIESTNSAKEAVLDSDIIITAGPILKKPQPTIEASWLKEGCFGAPIDYDSYWHKCALESAEHIYVDDTTQFEYYRSLGYFQDVPPVFGDLSQLISGKIPDRKSVV